MKIKYSLNYFRLKSHVVKTPSEQIQQTFGTGKNVRNSSSILGRMENPFLTERRYKEKNIRGVGIQKKHNIRHPD